MAPYTSTAPSEAQSHYAQRASAYDSANGGWHIALGQDFVDWLSPLPPNSVALDLACGTGLVTLPLASAVGSEGRVIGIDVTTAMLDVARAKPVPASAGRIEWVEHDVTKLRELGVVQDVLAERGGFDVITCCSAFVLLPDQKETLLGWVGLLRPGGRVILDVPTEDRTLQYLFTVEMRERLGLENHFDRSWIRGLESVRELVEGVGLTVVKGWKSRSYVPVTLYERDEGGRVWNEQVEKYKDFVQVGDERRIDARRMFLELWEESLNDEKRFEDGHWLYVVIGKKEIRESSS
jgi:ubiquinone/menaquinone biosynthesis C-methylase UbiE